jgi:hypothetical protein
MTINTKNLRPIESTDLIRMGRPNDGGYVIPEKIFSFCDGLLSYGINKDWSFEKDFWKKNPNTIIHCYDHSVSFLTLIFFTIKSFFLSILRLILLDRKRFEKEFSGLFVIPDYFNFFQKNRVYFKNRIWFNNDDNSKTIEDTLKEIYLSGAKNIFLKMDIETAEYKVLDDIFKTKKNIVGMAIEFHKIDEYSKEFNLLIDKILEKFYIVHAHGNNYGKLFGKNNFPSIVELTFIKKDYIVGPVKNSSKSYPIDGLDQPNRFSKPDCKLIF